MACLAACLSETHVHSKATSLGPLCGFKCSIHINQPFLSSCPLTYTHLSLLSFISPLFFHTLSYSGLSLSFSLSLSLSLLHFTQIYLTFETCSCLFGVVLSSLDLYRASQLFSPTRRGSQEPAGETAVPSLTPSCQLWLGSHVSLLDIVDKVH